MTQTSRTAIVTGGARGIGAAIARRLADDGHSVAVLDIDEQLCGPVVESIATSGGRAMAAQADISDEQQVGRAVEAVAAEFGPPTLLVNNAGILRDNLLFKMSVADWDAVMNVHLRGAFLATRAVQGHMVGQGFGRVVTISSTSALGNRGQSNYSAAKAGLQGFTRTLAVELGRFGVTANAIAPGFIQTEMTAATAQRMERPFDELIEEASRQIPVGRVGQPSDVAHVASFLTSEGAGFVNGQVIYVAGGPTV